MPHTVTAGHRYSLRRKLMQLVFVCVLPAAVVSITLAYSAYQVQREQVEQQTTLLARTILSDVEREFTSIESSLNVLATSPELSSGDLRAFHQRARDALAPNIGRNFIVTDREGRQLLNTLQPYGTALPLAGAPPQLAQVFSQKSTVLTDLFIGPVVRKPVIGIGVPVRVRGEVPYSLNVGIPPSRIATLVNLRDLPEDWLVVVLDSSNHVVTRSREPEKFMGQPAMPATVMALAKASEGHFEATSRDGDAVYTGFVQSRLWGWTVLVAAPQSLLEHEVMQQFTRVALGILAALALGLWMARNISLRVLAAVDELNDVALCLGKGEDVRLPAIQLQEAEAVGNAMLQASTAIKRVRFFAQHDALTELPNRLMFDEVASRSLAYAERRDQPLALLALDLDGFKSVNDTGGHAAGDAVLQMVALRIQQTIRASDMAARMGGDEFIVLLTDVTAERAMETAQRIIALLSQPYANTEVPVSVSVGVALYPAHGRDLKTLTAAADRAMYRAKEQGKQRAVLATVS